MTTRARRAHQPGAGARADADVGLRDNGRRLHGEAGVLQCRIFRRHREHLLRRARGPCLADVPAHREAEGLSLERLAAARASKAGRQRLEPDRRLHRRVRAADVVRRRRPGGRFLRLTRRPGCSTASPRSSRRRAAERTERMPVPILRCCRSLLLPAARGGATARRARRRGRLRSQDREGQGGAEHAARSASSRATRSSCAGPRTGRSCCTCTATTSRRRWSRVRSRRWRSGPRDRTVLGRGAQAERQGRPLAW